MANRDGGCPEWTTGPGRRHSALPRGKPLSSVDTAVASWAPTAVTALATPARRSRLAPSLLRRSNRRASSIGHPGRLRWRPRPIGHARHPCRAMVCTRCARAGLLVRAVPAHTVTPSRPLKGASTALPTSTRDYAQASCLVGAARGILPREIPRPRNPSLCRQGRAAHPCAAQGAPLLRRMCWASCTRLPPRLRAIHGAPGFAEVRAVAHGWVPGLRGVRGRAHAFVGSIGLRTG